MKNIFTEILAWLKLISAIILMILYLGISLSAIMSTGITLFSIFIFSAWWGTEIGNLAISNGIDTDFAELIAAGEVFLHLAIVVLPAYLYGKKFLCWWGSLFNKIGDWI